MYQVVDNPTPYFRQPDNTHCFQANLKMVLKKFFPQEEYSYEDLDKISGKEIDMWTWPMAGFLWLRNKGLEVECMEIFDYIRFAKEGPEYLREFYSEEVADAQLAHGNIPKEQENALEFSKKAKIIFKIPTVEDLKNYIRNDWLVICNVNSKKLNKLEGYSGHFVLIKGFDDLNGLIIHDPSINFGASSRVMLYEDFEAAWAYPDIEHKNLVAFKKVG